MFNPFAIRYLRFRIRSEILEYETFLFTIRFFKKCGQSIQTVEKLVWTELDIVPIRPEAPLMYGRIPLARAENNLKQLK